MSKIEWDNRSFLDAVNIVLESARLLGATYADSRVVERKTENLSTRNGVVEVLEKGEDMGVGVRLIKDGAWGFSATNLLDKESIRKTVRRALAVAKASARIGPEKVNLSFAPKVKAQYRTTHKIDPFLVSLNDKISLLIACDLMMIKTKKIKVAQSFIRAFRERKIFASTEGSLIHQEILECGAGIEAMAVEGNEAQNRSFPNSFRGQSGTQGYELVESLKLLENASRISEEAVALLQAPQCPNTTTDLILDGNQLALQVHESAGHPMELDRVLGFEASYAGTSFLTPEKRGQFRYGSSRVNIVADATAPGGLGTFGYDDEGVIAQSFPLVKEGIFVGYLTSRETAALFGERPNGCMRADGFANFPLIRMTNINLQPGDWELCDLIADTKKGLFLSTNKSWSIDDRRLNFQFGTEIAWEIKNGRRGKIYKNPTYTGITPQFWQSCDAICSERYYTLWGTPNCGKGEPSQLVHVGHGASPARFRNVRVGVGRW